MEQKLLNIGFGSTVVSERVIAVVSPNSAPMKRLKDEARKDKRLVDATHGRKTRAIIIMESNHVILSAIQSETISQRFSMVKDSQQQKLRSILADENEPDGL
ncbi:MAG: DUF370 domain-containing protein [Desulfobacterales bacterium]|nr:DUF370 domain-containing protein [Desulfobacterales bacterium]